MANSSFHVSAAEIEREIKEQARRDAEVKIQTKAKANEVKDYARSISPVDSGAYAAGWQVEDKVRLVNGMPAMRVANRNWKAHMIEDGTKGDPEGTHSPFGRDTPTPAFKVRAKTAAHFGGTEDTVEVAGS